MTYWDKWMSKYLLVKKYYEINGNINIPRSYEIDGVAIGAWLEHQREAYYGNNNSKLSSLQVKLLNDLKMVWNKCEQNWRNAYYLLQKYYIEHNNTSVPRDYKINNINLGLWVTTQRVAYFKKGTIRISNYHAWLLNNINFDWSPKKTKLLNCQITSENKDRYNEALVERVNYLIDDLVYEGINEIDSNNQDSIEKIMIKRIWR